MIFCTVFSPRYLKLGSPSGLVTKLFFNRLCFPKRSHQHDSKSVVVLYYSYVVKRLSHQTYFSQPQPSEELL